MTCLLLEAVRILEPRDGQVIHLSINLLFFLSFQIYQFLVFLTQLEHPKEVKDMKQRYAPVIQHYEQEVQERKS